MTDMTQTDKQIEIMKLVLRAADSGFFLDIGELQVTLSYGKDVTKQALQCSIRFLERHRMLARDYEVRRGRRRMILKPTPSAYLTYRGSATLSEEAELHPGTV
jgi:hypothetical protein